MTPRSRPALLLCVLSTMLIAAGDARAQTLTGLPVYRPNAFTIATRGEKPSLAVDAEGTAHVVWNEVGQGPVPDVLHYCRVLRGARRCTGEQTLVPPDGDPQFNHEFAHVQVLLPAPDQVVLLTSRYPNGVTLDRSGHDNTTACRSDDPPLPIDCYSTSTKTWMFRSTDNGASFASARILDHNPPGGDAEVIRVPVPVAGDAGATQLKPFVASVTETTTGGTFFTAAALDGYARDRVNLGDEGRDRAFYGSIAALGDTTPVVAFDDLDSNVYLRSHPDPQRSLTDIGGWTPSVTIKGDEPRLAGGPGGVYLIYKPRIGTTAGPYTVRRFDGRQLVGPAVRVSDVGQDQWRDLFEDDSGRLHTAWVSRQDSGSSFDELRYRFSADGQSFTAAATIARGSRNSIYDVDLGAADDGGGFAVYASTFSGNGTIRLAPFGSTAKRTLVDVAIAGVDVTQGIQQRTFAQRTGDPTQAASVPYAGVTLAALHTTVVRVYATSRRPLAGGAVPPMTLLGFKDGRQLGGGALLPDARPTAVPVAASDVIADADRLSTTAVYTFTLPWQWGQGSVVLRAEINPPGLLPAVAECRLCRADNTFSVTNLPFRSTTRVRVLPAAITVNGANPARYPDPGPLFAGARATFPLPFDLPDYRGTIDMSDLANATTVTVEKCFLGVFPCSSSQRAITQSERIGFALARLGDWAPDHSSSVFPIGVFRNGSTLGGATNGGGQLFGGRQPLSIVRDNRPLTSLAHEIGHGLGRAHAGLTCGSNDNGQIGEAWPPANDGALDGIGLDTTKAPPYRVLEGGQPAGPLTYFDLMSYCANTNENAGGANVPDAWVSIRNWERYITLNAPTLRRATGAPPSPSVPRVAVAAAATPRTLRVQALIPATGEPSILGVAPDAGAATPVDPAGRYTLVARDATGRALATAGAVGELQHVEHEAPVTIVTGRVPAAGATAVDVVQDGAPVSQRVASAHAPTVRVVAPRAGATVGAGGSISVRWSAADADAADRLTATVETSTDGGRHFAVVFIGASKGVLRLPAALLPASRDARIRVRVQDGFRETVATSGRLTSLGAPPSVRIVTPAAGVLATIEAGSALSVRGEAFDDTGRALTGLTWRVGRTVVARGALATIAGLPPGRPLIVLEAKDARGRRATAVVRVRITPRPPLFLKLQAPSRLSAKARKLTLTVAATYTATLRIGRTRAVVGRTPRKVVVAVKPGLSLLQLAARLTSGAAASSQVVQVPRR